MGSGKLARKQAFRDLVSCGQTDNEDVVFTELMTESMRNPAWSSNDLKRMGDKMLVDGISSDLVTRLNAALTTRKDRVQRLEAAANDPGTPTRSDLLRAKRVARLKAQKFMDILRQDPATEPVKEFTVIFGIQDKSRMGSIIQTHPLGDPMGTDINITVCIPWHNLCAIDEVETPDGKAYVVFGKVFPRQTHPHVKNRLFLMDYQAAANPHPNWAAGRKIYGGSIRSMDSDFRKAIQVKASHWANESFATINSFHAWADGAGGGWLAHPDDCHVTVRR